MDRRIADWAILETAAETLASEIKRLVSVRSRKTFEEALEDAERTKQRFIRQQARSGGKAAKADPLQKIIIDIVRQNPEIGVSKLLKKLQPRQGDGIIDEIEETHIHFIHTGTAALGQTDEAVGKRLTSASAPISGLKHRLTRARRKIREENRSR
jgi:hypothetical protein